MKRTLNQLLIAIALVTILGTIILCSGIVLKKIVFTKTQDWQIKANLQNNASMSKIGIFHFINMKNDIIFANFQNIFGNHPKQTFAQSNTKTYAKAKQNCILFKTTDTSNNQLSNIWFVIPETFFVSIEETSSRNIVKATYDKTIGYVKRESINVVSFIPSQPTLCEITTKVGINSTQLRTEPTTNSDLIIILNPNDVLEYVATAFGETPVGNQTDKWYYIKFTPPSNPTLYYEGYVFSERTTGLPPIPPNDENETIETFAPSYEEDIVSEPEPTTTTANETLKTPIKILLALTLCLPVLIFSSYLLVKNSHLSRR